MDVVPQAAGAAQGRRSDQLQGRLRVELLVGGVGRVHQAKLDPTALGGRLLRPGAVAQGVEVLALDRDHQALEPFRPSRWSGSKHDGTDPNVGPAAGLLYRSGALALRRLRGCCWS